jgi:putative transposase
MKKLFRGNIWGQHRLFYSYLYILYIFNPNNMSYNPDIHHRKSIRLKGYDYSQAGLYFITMCVQNRKCLFGKIVNDEMILNDAGKIADECWLKIPKHFPNSVLHEHIIMPNHVHGIVELTQNDVANVGAENFLPLQPPNESPAKNESPRNEFQKMIPRSIGSAVKGFKIGVTKWFRNNPAGEEDFLAPQVWQRNYHEHIIRNEQSYQRISEYIINNPKNWKDDKFYK